MSSSLKTALSLCDSRPEIDGIAFDFVHFYGSYYTVQPGRNWYRREVRLIKNNRGIVSHGDAQGFRKNGKKITAALCGAHIYHYGWVRPPEVMAEKIKAFHKLWHDDKWIEKNCSGREIGEFFPDLGNISEFSGRHPEIMEGLVNRDSEGFIRQCRQEYMKNRSFLRALKDFSRNLPFESHMNFKLVKI